MKPRESKKRPAKAASPTPNTQDQAAAKHTRSAPDTSGVRMVLTILAGSVAGISVSHLVVRALLADCPSTAERVAA